MKAYETLKLKVELLDSSDVIATSADVTTGGITMPWQKADDASGASFIDDVNSTNYNLG